MRKHEKQLHGIEEQQRKILATVRRETKVLEGQRESLVRQLEMERAKLAGIEARISEIRSLGAGVSVPSSSGIAISVGKGDHAMALEMDDSAESDSSESQQEDSLSLLQVKSRQNDIELLR